MPDEDRAKLVVVAGLPGSGKSTWARTHYLNNVIVSSDEIRKEIAGSLRAAQDGNIKPWPEFYTRIEDNLFRYGLAVADATFLPKRHRLRALDLASTYNAEAHLVFFTNKEEADMRNMRRGPDDRVPEEAFRGMLNDLYSDALLDSGYEPWDSVLYISSYRLPGCL